MDHLKAKIYRCIRVSILIHGEIESDVCPDNGRGGTDNVLLP